MPSRTLVTGANGRVGLVLRRGLSGLPITFTDRSMLDLGNVEALRRALDGYEQLIQLASPRPRPDWAETDFAPSLRMTSDVLAEAAAHGVRRVILPSSVLAASFTRLRGKRTEEIDGAERPETEYGRSRLRMEELGRTASAEGLDVVAIRLGAIRHPDAPSHQPALRPHWLSHEDCVELFRSCLAAPIVPGRFSLFYAVSDLPTRVLDISNPFGWTSRTKRVGFRRRALSALHRVNTGVRGRLQVRSRLKSILARLRG